MVKKRLAEVHETVKRLESARGKSPMVGEVTEEEDEEEVVVR